MRSQRKANTNKPSKKISVDRKVLQAVTNDLIAFSKQLAKSRAAQQSLRPQVNAQAQA